VGEGEVILGKRQHVWLTFHTVRLGARGGGEKGKATKIVLRSMDDERVVATKTLNTKRGGGCVFVL